MTYLAGRLHPEESGLRRSKCGDAWNHPALDPRNIDV